MRTLRECAAAICSNDDVARKTSTTATTSTHSVYNTGTANPRPPAYNTNATSCSPIRTGPTAEAWICTTKGTPDRIPSWKGDRETQDRTQTRT